ncbi:MAG: 2-phospho-L-lactate guanylyltransferase [Egibacteraceae bacterium]
MSSSPADTAVAVVPLKALSRAKGRLAGHLPARDRRELVAWMFARVIAACRGASGVGAVLVVAGDDAAADLARGLAVPVVVERKPGLAAAMAAADDATAAATASLVVAADLPFAGADDLDLVCRAGRRGPCVVVAPTRDGGTAALLRRPAGVIVPAYGPSSATAHLAAAAAAGARGVRLVVPALAFDVDTAEHLRALHPRDLGATWTDGLSAG